jgi:Ser/Thr protein kinase RdoA (MazF antagonist)
MKFKFSSKDIKKILESYNVGNYESHRQFPKGIVQINVEVKTDKGKFVLRKYRTRTLEQVKYEIELLRHLDKKKYLSQLPYQTKDKKYYVLHKNKPAVLLNYIEGNHLDVKKLTNKQLAEISQLLGKYHNIVNNFKPKFYDKRLNTDKKYILAQFPYVRKYAKKMKVDLEPSLKIVRDRLNEIEFPKILPKGSIHGDYHVGNMLFDKNKVSGILDFDDSNYSYLLFDVADLLDNFVFQNKFDFKKAKFMIKNYEKVRKLSSFEKNSLFDALRFRAMLFATWCMEFESKNELDIKKGVVGDIRRMLRLEKIGREEFYNSIF